MWTSDIERLICSLSVLSPYVKEFGFGIRKIFGWGIGNPEICACRIRNPGLWNPENRSENPESWALESGIQIRESGIHGVEFRIQDCLGFPSRGEYKLHTEYLPTCSTRWNDCLSNIILRLWYISVFRPKGKMYCYTYNWSFILQPLRDSDVTA